LVGFTFDPCRLDERASHVLLSAVLGGSEAVALKRMRLGAIGQSLVPIEVVQRLREPYPTLPKKLPVRCKVEDSESENRVLTLKPEHAFQPDQLERIRLRLEGWVAAVCKGAYGVSPASPLRCDCIPEEIHAFEDEIQWPLEKCRFHPAALDALAAVCVALHAQAPLFSECTIE
jgi:hypothetical protein